MRLKNYKATNLLLIGCLMISLGFNIYFIPRNIYSKDSIEPDIIISDNNKNEQNNSKQLICTKTEKSDEVETKTIFTMGIAYDGSINEQQKKIENTYIDNNRYINNKNLNSQDSAITYDDAKKQITKTFEKTKILNENGEEISIWYVNHQQQLEKIGYRCSITKNK